jgi:hypothetical protein
VLELGGPVDLAGDQQAVVDEQRGLAALDDGEPLAGQRSPAEGGQGLGLAPGDGDPPTGPAWG